MYYAIIRISDTKTVGIIQSMVTSNEGYNFLNIITPVGYCLIPITHLIPMGYLVDFEIKKPYCELFYYSFCKDCIKEKILNLQHEMGIKL